MKRQLSFGSDVSTCSGTDSTSGNFVDHVRLQFQFGCAPSLESWFHSLGNARAGTGVTEMDNLETQSWQPTPDDLVKAWGQVEKKEMELREREAELAEFESEHRRLKSQEKLRKQLQAQEARGAAVVEQSKRDSLPDDEKPATSP